MMTKTNFLFSALSVAIGLALAQPADAAWWNLRDRQNARSDGPVVRVQAEGGAERFNRIEAQMRSLTGQVEELTFQLRQLQDQLKRMQEDNDFRFGELEGGAVPSRSEGSAEASRPTEGADAPSDPSTPPPPSTMDDRPDAIGTLTGRGEVDMSGPGEPPRPLGTLRLPESELADQPIDLTAPPPVGSASEPQVAAVEPTGNPDSDYERAYANVLSGDYDTAEQGFRQFLAAYPDDERAPDAQYWLGESLFARAQFREAADAFLTGYKTYPKSGKAPDALLKLGLSLAGLGEREAACSTFAAVLNQYPNASNALRQRVKVEQSSASC